MYEPGTDKLAFFGKVDEVLNRNIPGYGTITNLSPFKSKATKNKRKLSRLDKRIENKVLESQRHMRRGADMNRQAMRTGLNPINKAISTFGYDNPELWTASKFLPVVGAFTSGYDASRQFGKGNWGQGAFELGAGLTSSLLPLGGGLLARSGSQAGRLGINLARAGKGLDKLDTPFGRTILKNTAKNRGLMSNAGQIGRNVVNPVNAFKTGLNLSAQGFNPIGRPLGSQIFNVFRTQDAREMHNYRPGVSPVRAEFTELMPNRPMLGKVLNHAIPAYYPSFRNRGYMGF